MRTTEHLAGVAAPVPPERSRGSRGPARRILELATAVAGTGMALVVGSDGAPLWRLVRVAAVVAVVAGVLSVSRRRPNGGLALPLAAAAVGLVAAPAGGSIGFPAISRAGWSPRAGGAVLAAVAGLVLVAVATVAAVRSVRGWRRLLPVPAALLAAYAVAYPVAVAVFATNVARTPLGSETPADRGLSFTDATFVTRDGVMLSGWYIPSANRAAVVLLHGASSTRSNVLDHATVMARHGYGVLLFDARGLGRSGGRGMNLGWHGDADVAAAVGYLEGRPDVDPGRIGAVGMSMGGEEALGAMASDPRIRAVVAEGATGRAAGDLAWLDEAYGTRGRVQQQVSRLTYALADLLTSARPPATLREALTRAAPRPVLLIAAGEVEEERLAGTYMREGAPASVGLWVVDGAGHTDGLRTQPDAWEARVVAFLGASLSVGP